MARFHRVLAPVVLVAPFAWLGACGRDAADIGLSLRAPQGLLDEATQVQLRVIDEGAAECEGGILAGEPAEDELEAFDLEPGFAGAAWGKEITLDQDDAVRVFHVLVNKAGQTVGEGCTARAVDQDPLDVDIKILRFNPPPCCGNNGVEPKEQCDSTALAATDCSGGTSGPAACRGIIPDFVCACDCLANEILVSPDGPIATNAPGSKFDVALGFHGSVGGSAQIAGGLRAVFGDGSNTGNGEINIVTLTKDLYPVTEPAVLGDATDPNFVKPKQLRLAMCGNDLTDPVHDINEQHHPDIARISKDTMAVVYASNQQQPTRFDVWVNFQASGACADAVPTTVNMGTDTTVACDYPSVAGGPDRTALIVWNEAGAINGRIASVNGTTVTLKPDLVVLKIGDAKVGTRPKVAGNADAWRVVWTTASDDIALKTVYPNESLGEQMPVNTVVDGIQSEPDVAMLPDGRFAVTWNDAGKIRFQRFVSTGEPVAGDQDQTATVVSPPAAAPAIAAAESGDFFALAWTAEGGAVWGRFLGGSAGFLYNHVDGQNGDFKASHPSPILVGPRYGAALAVSGNYVVFGWVDGSADPGQLGVKVRRLPVPYL